MQFVNVTLLIKLPSSKIVMGANINTNVGCNLQDDDDLLAPALGPHGPSKCSGKGKNLVDVYMSHGLRVIHTYYLEKRDIGHGTQTSTLNREQGMLNVMLCLITLHKRIKTAG